MPAAIVLKDAAAANVNFTTYSDKPDSVEWIEAGATSLLSTSRIRLSRKEPTNRGSGILRTQVRFQRPKVNGTTGALDGTVTINVEVLRPANVPDADVNEALARVNAYMALGHYATAIKTGALPA